MVCRDCLGRTPFASVIATIVCCVGVGLFCGALYRALDITLRGVFRDLFNINVEWLETMQVVFVIIAVVMGCFAIMLLVFGFLATGATRQSIYSGARCIMGGRVSAGFFMGVTYVLNFIWMGVTTFCALPIIIYIMIRSICIEEIEDKQLWYFDNYCLNLSRFGIYVNFTEGVDQNALCESTELGDFCQHVSDAGQLYSLAFGGSLLIVLGMVMFLIVLSSNYQRIKVSSELTDYRDAVDLELTDTRILQKSRSQISHLHSYNT